MDLANNLKNSQFVQAQNVDSDSKNSKNEANAHHSSNRSHHSRRRNHGEKPTANDFIFGKVIGEGSFSTVYLAKDKYSHKEYAAKVCDKIHIQKERKVLSVMREKEIMNILNDNECKKAPFFVKLASTFQNESSLYFILSYCKRGELLQLIQKVGNFDHASASFYTGELVRGLEHLHSLNIVHRDLKPENILLDERMHIKISDFGSAKILEKTEDNSVGLLRSSSFVGTAQYVSPEILNKKSVSLASDLWSLGCIIYQIVSGLPPFRSESEYMIFQYIQGLHYTFPQGFFEDAKNMVSQLLVLDSHKRLGADDCPGHYTQLRKHPFLAHLDLDSLYMADPPIITTYTPEIDDTKSIWERNTEPGLEGRELLLLEQMVIGENKSKCKTEDKPSSNTAACEAHNSQTNEGNAQQTPLQQPHSQKTSVQQAPVQQTPVQQVPVQLERKEEKPTTSATTPTPTARASRRERRNLANISVEEHKTRLQHQEKENKWHQFVDGNLILKQGLLDKRKGLFPRRRMFLLTTGPHLYYVDPINLVRKGEVPFSASINPEGKNFRTFFVHTPNRTYNLEDPHNTSQAWMQAIEEVRDFYFSSPHN